MEFIIFAYPLPGVWEQITYDYEFGTKYRIFLQGGFVVVTNYDYQLIHLYKNGFLLDPDSLVIIQKIARQAVIKNIDTN